MAKIKQWPVTGVNSSCMPVV